MAAIENFYARLGPRVRACRLRHGLTQAGLGARLVPPVTRASIANLEAGSQRVLAHTLVQLSAALGVTLDALAAPDTIPADRLSPIVAELGRKLRLPPRQLARLALRLGLAGPPTPRGTDIDPAGR